MSGFPFSLLDERTVFPEFSGDLVALRIHPDLSGDPAEVAVMKDLFHFLVEGGIELTDHLDPLLFSSSYLVEILLHIRREVVVHDVSEILLQIVGDYHSDLLREEFAPLCPYGFCLGDLGDRIVLERQIRDRNLATFLVAFDYVTSTGGQGADRGLVSRGTTDAQLLQFLHQGGF